MRYASIYSFEICNGEGVGISLFVQGCDFHCLGCFNSESWDFNGGKEWTEETENHFLELVSNPHIKRISILGGEPLAKNNVDKVLNIINRIRLLCPNKSIWLYSGHTWNQIFYPIVTDDLNQFRDEIINKRINIVSSCDVLVDGRFEKDKRDVTLKWRGSSNQRVIDIKESLKQNKVVLYCD